MSLTCCRSFSISIFILRSDASYCNVRIYSLAKVSLAFISACKSFFSKTSIVLAWSATFYFISSMSCFFFSSSSWRADWLTAPLFRISSTAFVACISIASDETCLFWFSMLFIVSSNICFMSRCFFRSSSSWSRSRSTTSSLSSTGSYCEPVPSICYCCGVIAASMLATCYCWSASATALANLEACGDLLILPPDPARCRYPFPRRVDESSKACCYGPALLFILISLLFWIMACEWLIDASSTSNTMVVFYFLLPLPRCVTWLTIVPLRPAVTFLGEFAVNLE